MSKKFVNNIEEVVDDSLRGLVFANSGAQIDSNCARVVLQSPLDKSIVGLVAGGGSGHEPYAAGYVGKGMLTGAVAGNVFASPPSRNVLAALEGVKSDAGVILFVINYTGDRLNFGLASERFNAAGGNSKVVTIGDDVAIDNPNSQVGRRGLAGAVLTIKVAGAMADQQMTIDDICAKTMEMVKPENMGTLGVSLYPGSLPGKKMETNLKDDEMEIGLGIHGEPGKERKKFATVRNIIQDVMERLSKKMKLKNDEENLVVMVNNLGSVSQIEMNLVNGEVLNWMESNGMKVQRFFSGLYMTSLDGHGISVTILRADTQIINYLDAPTNAPGWKSAMNIGRKMNTNSISESTTKLKDVQPSGASTDPSTVQKFVKSVCDAMQQSVDQLNKLDAAAGDGDCGSTFGSAASAIHKEFTNFEWEKPQTVLKQLSIIFEQTVGGTSGALYALMLSAAAASFTDETGFKACAEAFSKANQAVQKYGGARPGDRTMVDSLDALTKSLEQNPSDYGQAAESAETAAQSTTQQTATVGRASYTSAESQTSPDAGATAIALWIRAIEQAMRK